MRKTLRYLSVAAVGAAGLMLSQGQTARASVFTGSFDTIYSDNFTAPVVNVNAASTNPNAIVGNVPATSTGLDGGSVTATYLSTPISTGAAGTPDTDWVYSGSNSATITSPAANIVAGESTKTITNLTLPVVPVLGKAYDLELTMNAPTATGAHGLEMAFLFNNGNGHNTTSQAISNNNPVGLILDRDATASGTTPNYFDIFEGINTVGDTQFAPSASSLSGGVPGTTLTVDSVFTPTGATTGTMSWYINGILVNPTPLALTGLTNGVSFIQFGDNRDAGGTFTNFSLTAQTVPEPASMGLVALGGLMMARRRRGA
jgi:hypothetical protein